MYNRMVLTLSNLKPKPSNRTILLRHPLKRKLPGSSAYNGPYNPQGKDRNCGDFDRQKNAQAFFEAAGGPEQDPHRLDRDGDGAVCESLS